MFKSNFEKTLENATSHLHLEPDWASMLTLCDLIRQNEAPPKFAIAALKKKMFNQNPHTSYYALLALESIVKNCGPPVHEEITNKANCEMYAQLINTTQHENVKNKMLELIQTWAHAFREHHKYRSIKDTMNILKCEGHKFPQLKEADAMFTADVAPEWVDGDVCHRCRVTFSITQRKHHCRCCGQVFCGTCSSRSSRIPKYGIEKEVRVCDGCYVALQKPAYSTDLKKVEDNNSLPEEYLKSSLAQQPQLPPSKTEQEIQEEEELQLALALSQSEAEEKAKLRSTWQIQSYSSVSPNIKPIKRSPSPEEVNHPELSRYLNRNYWEQKNNTQQQVQQKDSPLSPTAPSPMSSVASSVPMKFGIDDPEMDEFVTLMRSQLEIFVNRMKSALTRGRNINNDTSIQSLFLNISSLHSKLLSYIKETDEKRMWYELLQDKIGQIKDSRAALDVLRQEHHEKVKRIAEEQERQRQIQMAQKLDIMRKKKQEYLQYQRQLALQRIQEQEREMHMRQEQQKSLYRMGNQSGYQAVDSTFMASGQYYGLTQSNILSNPTIAGHFMPAPNSVPNQSLPSMISAPLPIYSPNIGSQTPSIINHLNPVNQLQSEHNIDQAAKSNLIQPPSLQSGQQIIAENNLPTMQPTLSFQQAVLDTTQQLPTTQPLATEETKKETAIGELISFD